MQNGATFLLHVLHELFAYSFLRILKKKNYLTKHIMLKMQPQSQLIIYV